MSTERRAPGSGGQWLDFVFKFRDGVVTPPFAAGDKADRANRLRQGNESMTESGGAGFISRDLVPGQVRIVETLIKTSVGKPNKRALVAAALEPSPF